MYIRPLFEVVNPTPEEHDRFWDKVSVEGGCLVWTAYCSQRGYGAFRFRGKVVSAHRWCYAYMVGSIQEGMELDHLCRNRRCVAPWHLEQVTPLVNVLRGQSFSAKNARKEACPKGHRLAGDNIYINHGSRVCRICDNEAGRNWYRRRTESGNRPTWKRTACKHGHPFEPDNFYLSHSGRRECVTCRGKNRPGRK